MTTVRQTEQEDIRRLYAAFNRRDVDAVLERLAPDVCWANGLEGGHVEGRSAVREYWARQFTMIDPRVEPEDIWRPDDGRVAVRVHQVVRSLEGEVLADERVEHLYTFDNGQITRFDIGGDTRSASRMGS
jgi:ketosteroid isomerase-like protein